MDFNQAGIRRHAKNAAEKKLRKTKTGDITTYNNQTGKLGIDTVKDSHPDPKGVKHKWNYQPKAQKRSLLRY